ncbi:D-amino-acid oxidase [Auriculariales sp. MPI-PUGE-AT-0066]|nr:D-amino-acid oxidase [Auriculariales sp. MPI-PUGE-AT-0066]
MHIVVLGAGVVGLSTAVKAQDAGHTVTIVADILPGDPKSAEYTSPWAAAHHVSQATPEDKFQQELDTTTFREFWRMSEPESDASGCLMRMQQTDYYAFKLPRPSLLEQLNSALSRTERACPSSPGRHDIRHHLDRQRSVPAFPVLQVPRTGGCVARARVQHIDQVIAGAFTPGVLPETIFVCTGIGARFLGGVEDKSVYPIRGQTVVIRAPWIKSGHTYIGHETLTHILPRRSGDVVVGGTRGENDWYPLPRPEVAEDILQRALTLAPYIAPPEARADGRTPTVEDVKSIIVEHGCGFRPARKGGIRIEREWRELKVTTRRFL